MNLAWGWGWNVANSKVYGEMFLKAKTISRLKIKVDFKNSDFGSTSNLVHHPDFTLYWIKLPYQQEVQKMSPNTFPKISINHSILLLCNSNVMAF